MTSLVQLRPVAASGTLLSNVYTVVPEASAAQVQQQRQGVVTALPAYPSVASELLRASAVGFGPYTSRNVQAYVPAGVRAGVAAATVTAGATPLPPAYNAFGPELTVGTGLAVLPPLPPQPVPQTAVGNVLLQNYAAGAGLLAPGDLAPLPVASAWPSSTNRLPAISYATPIDYGGCAAMYPPVACSGYGYQYGSYGGCGGYGGGCGGGYGCRGGCGGGCRACLWR